ncbi:MAG: serine/threonine-protein kinase [Planctomycetota bacterium]|nr:serine/threonine-protein kinase [Planctomycetota bacterium]
MTAKTLSLFDLAPGKILLDRYKIVKTFRTGGMSTTFEVVDSDSKESREIQVFPGALFEDKTQATDFASAMGKWVDVESKHVLATHEVEALDDGTILFVTELPHGKSLREWRKDGVALEAAQVVEIGTQLLAGVEAIHAQRLVHGDIKPHTIHIEEKKALRVTLVDGGITPALWSAKHLGDKTALIGTPFYAPVEQFGGESPDVQSDVYNIATVLYELACGVLPWKGKSFLEIFQAKLEKRPPSMKERAPKSHVPPELESVILGGLMADRKERYGDAESFAKKLSKLDF